MPCCFKAPTMGPTMEPLTCSTTQKASGPLCYYKGIECSHVKTFLTTFKEVARAWYIQLSLGSIYSFEEFGQRFIARFQSSKRLERGSNFLFFIQQEEDESLRHYVGYFKAAMLKVRGLKPFVTMLALKRGLLEAVSTSPFPRNFLGAFQIFLLELKNTSILRKAWWEAKGEERLKMPREDHSHATLPPQQLQKQHPKKKLDKESRLDPGILGHFARRISLL